MLRYPVMRKQNPRQAAACALVMREFRRKRPWGELCRGRVDPAG